MGLLRRRCLSDRAAPPSRIHLTADSLTPSQPSPARAGFASGPDLRLGDLLLTVGITMVGTAGLVGLLLLVARLDRPFVHANAEVLLLLLGASIYGVFAVGILIGLRHVAHPARVLGLRRPQPATAVLIVIGLVPWFIGEGIVAALVALVFNRGQPLASNTRQLFVQRPHGVGVLLLALLVTAALAPLCEEVFFRGMLYRYLRARWPVWAAVLTSAGVFGLAHFSGVDRLPLLPVFAFMGVVLALVYEWTGSLGNTILLHALNNGILTVLAFGAVHE